jgi:SOS-response transcriptional repressor LexA|tara:strand:+ start:432 stop:668 length:237 start_codon:yes stop_codon:yes gene_type:complete
MLSKKEKELLDYIAVFQSTKHYTPSISEIGQGIKKHQATVSKMVKNLESRGIVARQDQKYRSLRILKHPSEVFDNDNS